MSTENEFETIAASIGKVFNENATATKAVLTRAFEKAGINYADPDLALKAAKNGRTDILSALRQAGVSMSTKNAQNHSLLHLAAQNGHEVTAAFLIGAGVSIYTKTKPEGFTPVHSAVYNNKLNIVKMLAGINRTVLADEDAAGNNAAHWAAAENYVEILEFIHQKNPAALKAKNADGLTPLALALKRPAAETSAIIYLRNLEAPSPK